MGARERGWPPRKSPLPGSGSCPVEELFRRGPAFAICSIALLSLILKRMNTRKIIEVKDLVKRYGEFTAVKGISFDVYEGEIFGLLGPNWAG